MATLFQVGDFTLRSGARSRWKIECDSLTADDWAGLAAMAAEVLPPFGRAVGVPRGGLPFADALAAYVTPGSDVLLLAEDVTTTGASLERFRAGRTAIGVAAFCRGECPAWVTPLMVFTSRAVRADR